MLFLLNKLPWEKEDMSPHDCMVYTVCIYTVYGLHHRFQIGHSVIKMNIRLWRACNLTAFAHSSTGPPICFLSWGTRVQSPGGYFCETGILLLVVSRYIGDLDMMNHCGLISGRLCPEPSLGRHTDNEIIPLDLTQLSCPGITLAAGPPSGFT
jgi:hypothetical protein